MCKLALTHAIYRIYNVEKASCGYRAKKIFIKQVVSAVLYLGDRTPDGDVSGSFTIARVSAILPHNSGPYLYILGMLL